MNTSKERLKYFLDYKHITVNYISSKIGISKSNFNENVMHLEIGTPILCKFMNYFPELNVEWVLLERGEMLKNPEHEPLIIIDIKHDLDYKEKYIELLEENRELRLEIDKSKKEIESLEKGKKLKNNTDALCKV